MEGRQYAFSWNLLGDIALGRPNLGPNTSVESYRLMQYTLRDVLEQHVGTEETDRVFYDAGKLSGLELYRNAFRGVTDFNGFVKRLQETLRTTGIGIVRVEEADMVKGSLILTVSEDLDCSGLPEVGYEACTYDEGFIAGLLEGFTGGAFTVKEVDCWCTGDRTCRFTAERVG